MSINILLGLISIVFGRWKLPTFLFSLDLTKITFKTLPGDRQLVVGHSFNTSTREAETGGSIGQVPGSRGSTDKPCLKQNETKTYQKQTNKQNLYGSIGIY